MIVPQLNLQCPVCGQHLDQIRQACPRCLCELDAYWPAVVRPLQAYGRSVELARSGQFIAAQRDAYLAVTLEPQRYEFRWLFSCLLAETDEIDEAIAQGQAAWELAPENAELQQWLESLFARRFARAAEVAAATDGVQETPTTSATESVTAGTSREEGDDS